MRLRVGMPIGFKHSEESKMKISEARLGKPHPMVSKVFNRRNSGSKHSLETRSQMSAERSGNKHWNWKGGVSLNRKEYQKAWILKNKDHVREYDKKNKIRWNYGLSFSEYESLYLSQSGKCAICFTEESSLKKRLCVDHDHLTGKVRGLLCGLCNSALGGMKDNKENILNMIKYLEKK